MKLSTDWTERVSQLRQYVMDVPEAPRSTSDVDFYIVELADSIIEDGGSAGELTKNDTHFLDEEFERQYGPLVQDA